MATRKCENIYFPKYFMAVRPFLTKIFFQELLGLEGNNVSREPTININRSTKIFVNFLTAIIFPEMNISALSGRHCGPHPSSIK